jgi:hypothetical protein
VLVSVPTSNNCSIAQQHEAFAPSNGFPKQSWWPVAVSKMQRNPQLAFSGGGGSGGAGGVVGGTPQKVSSSVSVQPVPAP